MLISWLPNGETLLLLRAPRFSQEQWAGSQQGR